jgi:hypothetical protein
VTLCCAAGNCTVCRDHFARTGRRHDGVMSMFVPPTDERETGMETIPVRPEFEVHLLNDTGKERAADIAKMFTVCLNNLESIIGADGREMAIVRTKLQEAAFFAKRAMAVKPENHL